MKPVIMSGGSGTRLWPLSRENWPKQFVKLFEKSLMELTLDRVRSLGAPWVLTSQSMKDLTNLSLFQTQVKGARILLEPMAKNTAPAIAFLVTSMIAEGLEDEVVGVLPADHLIEDVQVFLKAMRMAEAAALQGKVATIGVKPSRPETGFGYIEVTKGIEHGEETLAVVGFHEKPSVKKAEEFLKAGKYLWNSGMFVFQVQTMKKHLEKHCPDILLLFEQVQRKQLSLEEAYSRMPSVSIDYAVMEKLSGSEISCVSADLIWSDVGSWDAVAEKIPSQDAVTVNSDNVFVKGIQGKTYGVIGLDNIQIIDTSDALLVLKEGLSQDVRIVVEKLKAAKNSALREVKTEIRPWGEFSILKETEEFKSKVIRVNPNSAISYQSHAHREEHWTITSGVGEVIINDAVTPVRKGSYIFIPRGAKHRIRNTGATMIEFIEVQMGDYFGEDDIVRYSDDYNRV